MKNNKGFTLIELLAVVTILGILMIIGIPSVNRIIEDSRTKAFYASVYNVVSELKLSNIENNKSNCIYDYQISEGQNSNIGRLNIWAHQKDGKIIYSVLAYKKGNEEETKADINIYDFSNTNTNRSTWVGEGENSYSEPFIASYISYLESINNPDNNVFLSTIDSLGNCIEED